MSGSTITLPSGAKPRRKVLLATALLCGALGAGCGGDIESRMAEVRALQDVGQFDASTEELQEILAIDPDLPEANYRLGLAQVQMGEPSRAIWALQKAMENSEYQIPAGVLLASTHQQTKNYDEAIRAATRVLEADPEREAALRIRATSLLGARRLDEALEDTTRLVELFPDDYVVRALHATVLADLHRLDEAEKEHELVKKIGLQSDDPDVRMRACLAVAVFHKDVKKDLEKARTAYNECAEQHPTDPTLLANVVGFFDTVKEPERGTEIIRQSVEAAPENLALRRMLASRLRVLGDAEGAEKVLLETVETFGSAPAYDALAQYYRAQKQSEKALEALAKVAELSGGGSDALRFTQADTLIDVGRNDEAREIAGKIKQPAYRELILGRLALVSGDPKTALASFEKGIQAWPNNAGARFLAGLAARDLGDEERAIAELRESVRGGVEETDAALELARILYARGDYKESILFANMALQGPGGPTQAEPYVVGARAMAAAGQLPRARASAESLRRLGHDVEGVRELALIERGASGPEASQKVIAASKLDLADPANLEVLTQSVENLSLLGKSREALAALDAAAARSPESARLFELRGLVQGRAGDAKAARASFEKALELAPDSAHAMAGLATLRAQAGEYAAAIELFEKADAVERGDGAYAYSAAQIALASGQREDAIARMRKVVQQHPEQTGARNDLAFLLAEDRKDLDLALSLAEEARRRSPSPEVLDTLGFVYLQRGEAKEAVAVLEQAVAGDPQSASIRYRLGSALEKAGEKERAKETFAAALALGDFPEAEAARAELARLSK
ncbi:MAG TPA: tetratricopeptide repeat protein [Myxococcota bacterium]|nr:tetratricopeptide repeat protein [Myxococcota bacterium]